MECKLCNKPQSPGEQFVGLRWDKVDIEQYNQRVEEERPIWIVGVCLLCYNKYNQNRPPLSLKDVEIIRSTGITEDEYYKSKGY